MSRRIGPLALIALVAVLPSCVSEFEQPLVDPAQAQLDTLLSGNWTVKQANGSVQTLMIGIEPNAPITPGAEAVEPGTAKFVMVSREPDNKLGDPLTMRFVSTTIGNQSYASLVVPADPEHGKSQRYWLVKYRVSGDQLTTWYCDFEATGRMIEAGRLRGKAVREGANLKSVWVTDSADSLAKFLQDGGDAILFPEAGKVVYQRMH
ncbi:MAG: hypothetical protein K1X74_09900 [Pirellulales bacterium]|nr:hypothetical protein [Pirellulales bacterium]